ncbi:hypothetical protein F5Y13DRAFT_171055 [Hypoxylon sp. FL1857]|nr:hypothetical protein F5Y13DRAFT_171055 [Hypoxylon sp. FL1857]
MEPTGRIACSVTTHRRLSQWPTIPPTERWSDAEEPWFSHCRRIIASPDDFLTTCTSQEKGIVRFSLALADNPEVVLAMCKTLHRDLLIRDGAGLRQEQGYCICSVITDSCYRNRGLATVLMKNIAEWVDGPGGATASTLYSEVGDFYVRRGWDILDAFQSTLTVPPSLPSGESQAKLPNTRLLSAEDLPGLCERDVESIKEDFRRYDLAPGTTLITALPTTDMVDWQQNRIGFMNAKLLGKCSKWKGSICESDDAWMYWYHDLYHRKLIIQRAKLPKNRGDEVTIQVLARLLLDALEEAVKWEIPHVLIWNPGSELHSAMGFLNEEFGIEVLNEKREVADIPCLRWRGGEKKPTIVRPRLMSFTAGAKCFNQSRCPSYLLVK